MSHYFPQGFDLADSIALYTRLEEHAYRMTIKATKDAFLLMDGALITIQRRQPK